MLSGKIHQFFGKKSSGTLYFLSRKALQANKASLVHSSSSLQKNDNSKQFTQTLDENRKTMLEDTRKYVQQLEFLDPKLEDSIPIYRVFDQQGKVIEPSQDPNLSESTLHRMYRAMKTLNMMDSMMFAAQRQGKISFYLTNYGEEASHIGSAAALDDRDLIFGQYREAGVLMWRGFSVEDFMDQCYGSCNDPAAGKQMPVHYGSRKLNFVTISSPIATQIPQASGAAYAFKRTHPGLCVICYFGEGAASEGDAHAGLNFAATLDAPCLFFCRNNGYAISTSLSEQYRGDGIASRGSGYGMLTIRVDGNDLLAVYNATMKARKIAVEESRPVLIESMSYRISDHSTSVDSVLYRTKEEIKHWSQNDNPITRFRLYMTNERNCWSDDLEAELMTETKSLILKSFAAVEKRRKPSPSTLFTDVYNNIPPHLQKQYADMKDHVTKYQDYYPLSKHETM